MYTLYIVGKPGAMTDAIVYHSHRTFLKYIADVEAVPK
jgi:hypothetical protein